MPASPPDSYGAEDWAPTSGGGAGSWAGAAEPEPRRRGGHRRADPDDGADDLSGPHSGPSDVSGGWRVRPAVGDFADDGEFREDGFHDGGRYGDDGRFRDDGRYGDGDRYRDEVPVDDRDAHRDAEPDDEPWSDSEPRPDRADRPLPVAPVRRLLSLGMAGLSVLLAVAMMVGAQLTPEAYGLVVFGAQVLFVVVWTVASQPPGARIVAGIGIAVAAGADLAAAMVNPASLAPLAYLTAAGFVAAVVGQLLRPAGRVRVTESLGSSLVVVVGVVALATLIVLGRRPLGDQVIVAIIAGAGAALLVAHLVDTLGPIPRVAPPVARGGAGVVAGAMVGTAASGLAGHFLEGMSPLPTALAGLVAAVIALMVDLSANYAEASRRLAGAAPALWLVRHMQGPLAAFALAAPTAYAAALVLARGL